MSIETREEAAVQVPVSSAGRVPAIVSDLLEEWDLDELRGGWEAEILAGGAINDNYVLTSRNGERFVLRIVKPGPSERLRLDRGRALRAHRAAAEHGVAPAVTAHKLPEGHYLSRFLEAETVTEEVLRRPGVLESIGGILRKLHGAGPIEGDFSSFADTRIYLQIAVGEGLALPGDIDAIALKLDQVERLFDTLADEPVLCHGDLVIQNLLLSDGRLWVIDFDYAGMGNRYFDLGEVTSKGSLDDDGRCALVAGYFGRYDPVHDARVRLMAFMSGLREAMWSVVASSVLDQEWDYVAWDEEHFRRCRGAASSTAFYPLL